MEGIKQNLLIGHLLRLISQMEKNDDQSSKYMLPVLSLYLEKCDIIPKWLNEMLIQKPVVFEQAFRKLFEKVIFKKI